MPFSMLANIALLLTTGGSSIAAATQHNCTTGTIVPYSDRTSESPCIVAQIGHECAYRCNPGYIRIGRHVCQTFTQDGTIIINRSFFGGRCDRLCAATASPCPAGSVPTRVNSSDPGGPCLRTACATPDMTLQKLAGGAAANATIPPTQHQATWLRQRQVWGPFSSAGWRISTLWKSLKTDA
eukprot:COSAG05_NODE_249_length_12903_cov_128.635505_10_plen_182_part_00